MAGVCHWGNAKRSCEAAMMKVLMGTFAIREGDRAWPLLLTWALRLRIGSPEIKLAIVKQAEFKLATDLGGIGPIQK